MVLTAPGCRLLFPSQKAVDEAPSSALLCWVPRASPNTEHRGCVFQRGLRTVLSHSLVLRDSDQRDRGCGHPFCSGLTRQQRRLVTLLFSRLCGGQMASHFPPTGPPSPLPWVLCSITPFTVSSHTHNPSKSGSQKPLDPRQTFYSFLSREDVSQRVSVWREKGSTQTPPRLGLYFI